MISRRGFLERSLTAAALGVTRGVPRHLWTATPAQLLPEIDEAKMRELALKALDAARQAGASFADIRLTVGRQVQTGARLAVESGRGAQMIVPTIDMPIGYGLRAIVNGGWGFASGVGLDADAAVAVGRSAVRGARTTKPRKGKGVELAPVPRVANGRWATPMDRDPLTVPFRDQGDIALAAVAEAAKVPELVEADVSFAWRRPLHFFASTDGTMLVQDISFANPQAGVKARIGDTIWSEAGVVIDSARRGGYGYEAMPIATLAREMREGGERAVALARMANGAVTVDVGRYDLVLSAQSVVPLLANTIGEAVNLERALGYWAWSGTSFAEPPMEVLGAMRVASPLLTVHADRTTPHAAGTVGWDDEGVAPEAYTIVREGIVTDYHTNRETTPAIAAWYRKQGKAATPHGCARNTASERPATRLPNLAVAPAAGGGTVDDLIRDTKRGFFVDGALGGGDQRLLTAQFACPHTGVREIRNGKLGRYVKDFGVQVATQAFWKSIDAIGGRRSAIATPYVIDFNALMTPIQPAPASTVSTVPMRAIKANVVNLGRTA